MIAFPRRVAVHYHVVGKKAKEISTGLMESDPSLGYALLKKLVVLLTSELTSFAAG